MPTLSAECLPNFVNPRPKLPCAGAGSAATSMRVAIGRSEKILLGRMTFSFGTVRSRVGSPQASAWVALRVSGANMRVLFANGVPERVSGLFSARNRVPGLRGDVLESEHGRG